MTSEMVTIEVEKGGGLWAINELRHERGVRLPWWGEGSRIIGRDAAGDWKGLDSMGRPCAFWSSKEILSYDRWLPYLEPGSPEWADKAGKTQWVQPVGNP
ncbi:MAG TPA: hypothetical protein VM537_15830, partial [Anaerolineae bacterium]|nr:hypothetical protein [Anaerolineae bacterium]